MDVPIEKFLSWPPFYTLQPNLDTQSQQLALWTSVLLDYGKKNRIFVGTIESFEGATRNNSLNRSLGAEFKNALVSYMVKQKVFVSDGLSFLVFWQKPETWAEGIYKWASDSGRIGTVETVEGLVTGDETTGEEFYGMPLNFAFHVLKTLEKSRKAELFKVGEGYAIKFF